MENSFVEDFTATLQRQWCLRLPQGQDLSSDELPLLVALDAYTAALKETRLGRTLTEKG